MAHTIIGILAGIFTTIAFLPQVIGKARGMSGPLDLDNFERANYRVKLAIAF